jgi:hypothetical protein
MREEVEIVSNKVPEIRSLIDAIPSVCAEAKTVLDKIEKIAESPGPVSIEESAIQIKVVEAMRRCETQKGREPQSPTVLIARTIEELGDCLNFDARWIVARANLLLSFGYAGEVLGHNSQPLIDKERKKIVKRCLEIIKGKMKPFGSSVEDIAVNSMNFALVSDSPLIRNYYYKGNPSEPLLDLCVLGTTPLGIIKGKFVVYVPSEVSSSNTPLSA